MSRLTSSDSSDPSRRPARVVGFLSMAALLLVSCGGEPSATNQTETPAQSATDGATDGETPTATPDGGEEVSIDGTVEFVVPYDAGGGFDAYARLIAPALSECLGNEVIVVNEPGAGTLLATNATAAAPPDGTRIQIFNTQGVISAQVGGAEGVQFDLTEMTWLGRVLNEPDLVQVGADSEFESFEDMVEADRPIRFGTTGVGGGEGVSASAISRAFGMDAEIISGFDGSGEVQASVIQGDLDATVFPVGSSLKAIEAGDLRPLLVISEERHDDLPDVPAITEFEPVEGESEVVDAMVNLVETTRAIGAPGGMDPELTEHLRDATECALTDPEFLERAEAQDRDVNFLNGAELQARIEDAVDAPPALAELFQEAFGS